MSEPLDASEDQLVQYVLGELRRDEAQALERRLGEDEALAAEVWRLRQGLDLMPYASITEPPPALRDRILSTAAAPQAPAGEGRPPRPIVWGRLAAPAAAPPARALRVRPHPPPPP